ncbi:hypothetical protein BJV78DRAFT_1242491 [Lactifluus subvellereus]|nr:hypothetical protein BJV78DRAFT_1242491 [Lactifluus subvellereus]
MLPATLCSNVPASSYLSGCRPLISPQCYCHCADQDMSFSSQLRLPIALARYMAEI